jgi:predicted alpha/beta hydrolase family esterase
MVQSGEPVLRSCRVMALPPVVVERLVGKALIVWVGGFLALVIGLRLAAPLMVELSWAQKAYADRAKSNEALVRSTQLSVETIVARPLGMLVAARTCGDTPLETRAANAVATFARKSQRGNVVQADAMVVDYYTRANKVDPKFLVVLKKDCHKTLELAELAVTNFEKRER